MYPRRRRVNNRAFIKKFVISCEGSVTEKEYFTLLQSFCWQYAFIDILTDKQEKITFAIGQSLATIPVDCVGTNVGVLVDRITRDAFSTTTEVSR